MGSNNMETPFNIFMFYLDHGQKIFFASGLENVRSGLDCGDKVCFGFQIMEVSSKLVEI